MENRFKKLKPVLVTGATGYVGGRLVPQLLASGYRVRVVGRSLSKLRCRPWGGHPQVELAQGDVLDARSLAGALEDCGDASYAGGTILESGYRALIKGTPEDLWKNVKRIGGSRGWYFADSLWRLRGLTDRMIGGVGSRRGRRHPDELFPGDAIDSWRVLEVKDQRRLLLLAEMKLPGEALLEFRIYPFDEKRTEILQLSRFLPRGLFGLLYWYGLYPFHQWVFRGMARNIARASGEPILKNP